MILASIIKLNGWQTTEEIIYVRVYVENEQNKYCIT